MDWAKKLRRACSDIRNEEGIVSHSINGDFCVRLMAAGQGGTREQSHRRGHKSNKVIVNPGLRCECNSSWWSALVGPNPSDRRWYGTCPWLGGRGSPGSCLGTCMERGASGQAYAYLTLHPHPSEHLRATSEITAGTWATKVQNISFSLSYYLSAEQSIMFAGEDPKQEAGVHCQAGLSCLGSATW